MVSPRQEMLLPAAKKKKKKKPETAFEATVTANQRP